MDLTHKKVVFNIGWMFIDKIFKIIVGLFVGVWVARYLGPEQYGLWNFAIAFSALFGAIAPIGIIGILTRDFVKFPEKQNELLGSAFVLRLIGGFLAFFLSLISITIIRPRDLLAVVLVGLLSAGFIFQSFNIIELYFQSKIQSKYTVAASSLAFLITSALKIILILSNAPLIAFGIAGLIEIILTSVFLIITYQYNQLNIRQWKFDINIAKKLIKDGWTLTFGSLAAMIYMRIDQIIIGHMLNNEAVGYYAVAVRLSESFLFLTVIISDSAMPYLTKIRTQNKEIYFEKLRNFYGILLKIAFFISLCFTLFSKDIINALYGIKYIQASDILSVYIWSSFFVFFSNSSWIYYYNENVQHLATIRLIVGAIINVILNLVLIKSYGLIGAALATLISYSISSYFFNLFNRKLLINFKLQTQAIIDIFRLRSYFLLLQKVKELRDVRNPL